MQTRIVQILFLILSTVVAGACQDMWPAFCGAKPPFLLALVLHAAFQKANYDESDRHVEKPPDPLLPVQRPPHLLADLPPLGGVHAVGERILAQIAGAFEDALSDFPVGCATGYFLLAGAAARFLRNFIHVLRPAVLGLVVAMAAAPFHELWLAVWGVSGDQQALFIRFFAAAIPAVPVGAFLFFLLPHLETAVGFDGPDTNRRLS